jgi:hypothetical protein
MPSETTILILDIWTRFYPTSAQHKNEIHYGKIPSISRGGPKPTPGLLKDYIMPMYIALVQFTEKGIHGRQADDPFTGRIRRFEIGIPLGARSFNANEPSGH